MIVAAAAAPGEGGSPPSPPAQALLMLRNGQVLEGRITHADGAYTVEVPNGQMRIKDADVDMLCNSLEDGYRRKWALIQVGNVYHHLDLTQWCLRHHLLGPAAVELADARLADAKNPMIAVLEYRLKVALEPPPPNSGNASPPVPRVKSSTAWSRACRIGQSRRLRKRSSRCC